MVDEPLIQIDESGAILVEDEPLRRRLAGRAGAWRIVPSLPDLLILHRADDVKDREGDLPKGPPGTRVVLCGEIDGSGALVDVVNFVNTSQWSGALSVLEGAARKTIFFRRGDVKNASSNVSDDRLGAILYRFGMVTQEQLEAALGAVSHEQKLGHVLVEMGAITTHDLYNFVRKQIEEIFHSVLLQRGGAYYFYKEVDESRSPATIHLDTKNLLFEGVRRMDELAYFRERLPSANVVLDRKGGPPNWKKLEPQAEKAWAAIDGVRDLAAVARESRLGEFDAMKAVFQLVQAGVVTVLQAPEVSTTGLQASRAMVGLQKIIDTFNYVFAKIYAAVAAKGKEEVLRKALASFFQGQTGYAELFSGISPAVGGTLPADRLLVNLDRVRVDNKPEYLRQGLNELLFFEMFTVGEAIDRRDERELHARLNRILSELG